MFRWELTRLTTSAAEMGCIRGPLVEKCYMHARIPPHVFNAGYPISGPVNVKMFTNALPTTKPEERQ